MSPDEILSVYSDRVKQTFQEITRRRERDVHQLSISSLGACLRQSAYRLAKTPPSDTPPETPEDRRAHLGTATHDMLLPVFADLCEGMLVEHPVTLTAGGLSLPGHIGVSVPGRLDVYDPALRVLVDLKTVGKWMWTRVAEQGPPRTHIDQSAGYATALVQAGMPVDWLMWIYLNRETGEEQIMIRAYDTDAGVHVINRVHTIVKHAGDPDQAPREAQGPSAWIGRSWSPCDACPWLSRCWGSNPGSSTPPQAAALADVGIARALEIYAEGRQAVSRASEQKAFAASLLTAAPEGRYGDYAYKRTKTGAINVTRVPARTRVLPEQTGETS